MTSKKKDIYYNSWRKFFTFFSLEKSFVCLFLTLPKSLKCYQFPVTKSQVLILNLQPTWTVLKNNNVIKKKKK